MWSIRILSGPQAGQVHDLKLGKNVFGRGGQSQFKIQSLGISKEHCEIHVYKDKMIVVDLKSSNGTFVNGVKIQNSLIQVGDKISLFDIILDIIPSPDLRPMKNVVALHPNSPKSNTPSNELMINAPPPPPVVHPTAFNGNAAMQMNTFAPSQPQSLVPPPEPALTISEKIENFIETVAMPGVYKLGILFSFKQVLLGFVMCFIFGVTILSMIPLTTITKESNLQEAAKRAKSVARALAKVNEQALLSNQFGSLNVSDALKEDGIKEAFIIQQSDGSIVAPSEKVGRDTSSAFILQARKESRASASRIDSTTLGASHPIGVYDPVSGEPTVKYHAVVIYDVSSLNIDEGRIISLFMQTLIIASIMGLMLYYLFARLIEFPLRSLNKQIDQALLDKSDRTEVLFDYPVFQKLVSNVNTLLNRAWTGGGIEKINQPQQNRDLEYSNLVDIISHPAIVVSVDQRIVACNGPFEQLSQMSKDQLVNQPLQAITDSALSQIIDSLIVRCKQSPYDTQMDQIPFSQFECKISSQAFLNSLGEAEYFVMTLIPSEPS
ncbi:MAG: FHA domain-containing protein [Bdellovibrionaceae bacterium]|nr:FHA domain-containing protein [Bdellovibrio sp.]